MEINGKINTKVNIDPIEVIENLLELELGYRYRYYISEENGLFYKKFNGDRYEADETIEISAEKYDYIKSLKTVIRYLRTKEKN